MSDMLYTYTLYAIMMGVCDALMTDEVQIFFVMHWTVDVICNLQLLLHS